MIKMTFESGYFILLSLMSVCSLSYCLKEQKKRICIYEIWHENEARCKETGQIMTGRRVS